MAKKIKYKATWFRYPRIEEVHIDKETKSYIWINGIRRSKETYSKKYFDTFNDAYFFLRNMKEKEIYYLEKKIEKAKETIKHIEKIKQKQKHES